MARVGQGRFLLDTSYSLLATKTMGGRKVKEIKEDISQQPLASSKEDAAKPEEGKKPVKKVSKPHAKKARGKKYQAVAAKREVKEYSLEEAVEKVKELSFAKFDASVDAHFTLELPKDVTQLRVFCSLPHGTGKTLKVLVFSKPEDEAKIEEIAQSSKVDADSIVATPAMMPKLAKIARILGPRGLMPTPKTGTVTDTPEKVVEELQKGKVEVKTEPKAPVAHLSIGKVSFPAEHLAANFKAVSEAIKKSQAKVKSVSVAPSMGPSVKIKLDSLDAIKDR